MPKGTNNRNAVKNTTQYASMKRENKKEIEDCAVLMQHIGEMAVSAMWDQGNEKVREKAKEDYMNVTEMIKMWRKIMPKDIKIEEY